MSQVLSLQVSDQMAERLERFARRQGHDMTRSKAGLLLLEEGLREAEFTSIDYRNTLLGRQPFVTGTGMAVWEVILIARSFDFEAARMAEAYPTP